MILVSNTSKNQNTSQISELGIEELRLMYDREESRNDTFETKASSLFGFSSLLIGILIFTLNSILSDSENTILSLILSISSNISLWSIISIILLILNIIGILIIFLGLISLINALKIRNYMTPFAFDPNEIHLLLIKSSEDLKNYMIEDYRRSIPHIFCLNEKKADYLDKAINYLKQGIFLSIMPLMFLLFIKVVAK